MVQYEWVVEEQEMEDGELVVIDTHHFNTYARACIGVMAVRARTDSLDSAVIGLTRDSDDGKAWAYVYDGVIEPMMKDSGDVPVIAVPKHLMKQVINYHKF